MDLLHNAFTSGVLAPEMDGRPDLPEYYRGCRALTNFYVKPQGGAFKRPGFVHIGEVGTSADSTRLVGFVTATTAYVLEFGDYEMRVWKDGAIVNDGASPYTLTTPYAKADVFDLVFAPRGQVIYHPSYEPRKLATTADTTWTLTAASFQYGPFLDENEDTTLTITPSGTTGSITLTASSSLFNANHVGSLWKMTHYVDEAKISGKFYSTQNTAWLSVEGDYELRVTERWAGIMILQRTEDGGTTVKDVKSWRRASPSTTPIVYKNTETEEGVEYRLNFTWYGTDPDSPALFDELYKLTHRCQYQLSVKDTWQTGIVRITGYTSATEVSATVLNTLGAAEATHRWYEGSWSADQGYPTCGTIHESRLVGANTTEQPMGFWAGQSFKRIGDVRTMYPGTEADEAITRGEVDLKGHHKILWAYSLWVLLLGTDGGILKVVGPGADAAITPTDCNFIPQSGVGSAALQPVEIAGNVVYAGRDSKHVYELEYSDDTKKYNPEHLTKYAEHITGDGIVDWAFQQQPYPILWAVTSGGDLIGLTRDRQEDLIAWHKHTTDGNFESVAVIPASTRDEVWVIVNRTVNGSTMRCVERMASFELADSQRDHIYVDGSTTWDGGAAVTVTDVSVASGTGRVTVTAAGHGFSNGYTVKFASVGGCTALNDKVYTVADAATNTFALKTRDGTAYIDGSSFGTYTSGGTVERVANSVSGLTQLAGATVSVLLDGQPTTGTVTTAGVYSAGSSAKDRNYYNTITVGRAITSVLSPMRPEVKTYSGSIALRKKKITSCGVRLYQSYGGSIGTNASDLTTIDYTERGDASGADVATVTQDKYVAHPGGWQEEGDIYVQHSDPLPFNVSAVLFGLEA